MCTTVVYVCSVSPAMLSVFYLDVNIFEPYYIVTGSQNCCREKGTTERTKFVLLSTFGIEAWY